MKRQEKRQQEIKVLKKLRQEHSEYPVVGAVSSTIASSLLEEASEVQKKKKTLNKKNQQIKWTRIDAQNTRREVNTKQG